MLRDLCVINGFGFICNDMVTTKYLWKDGVHLQDLGTSIMTVKEIISVYSNHPSIRKIKNLCVPENKFDLPYASTSDINKIINHLM